MKKRTYSFIAVTGLILANFILSFNALGYPSGSPAGYTGSPGDGHHCVSCHGGSAATVSGWITSNIPASGYIAGTVYTITATVSGTGKKGFEVSPQDAIGTQLGILTAGTGSHLVGGTKYVTQNAAGSSSGTSIYNFTWTAPSAGTGPVTFYGAFTVGKSATKLSTLVVTEGVAIPISAIASSTPGLICAGQGSQLNVLPSGGSGSYTYSWSSTPAGFTSSIQNPIAWPTVSTQYIVHVSDGSLSVDDTAYVSVTQRPVANAGNDATYSPLATQISLNGVAANYSGLTWSAPMGTGTFSAPGSLTGFYYPGAADKTAGMVVLTLMADGQSPCTMDMDTVTIHFDWPTGMATTNSGQAGMVISPNPTHGRFSVRVSGFDNELARISVSDITGRTIVQSVMNSTDIRQEPFDLSEYPRGLYLVKIKSDTQTLVRKLVID